MDDEEALRAYGRALADAIDQALPGWVTGQVGRVLVAHRGRADPAVLADATAAGETARREVGAEVRRLLEASIDEQWTTPLAIVRRAVRYPAAVLDRAGVPSVERDEFAEHSFPDDLYDLSPATFADVDESLREPALLWGAAKAHVHLTRRKAAGRS